MPVRLMRTGSYRSQSIKKRNIYQTIALLKDELEAKIGGKKD